MEDKKSLSAYDLIGITEEQALEIGARLKQKRENDLHLEISALSQKSKINTQYLESIEAGKWHELPVGVFGRNFVKLYAKELNCPLPEFEQNLENKETLVTHHTKSNLDLMVAVARSKSDVHANQTKQFAKKLISTSFAILKFITKNRTVKKTDNDAVVRKSLLKSKLFLGGSLVGVGAAITIFAVVNHNGNQNENILPLETIQDAIALDNIENSNFSESEIAKQPIFEQQNFKTESQSILNEQEPMKEQVIANMETQKMEIDVLSPVGVSIEADGKQIIDGLTQPGKMDIQFQKKLVLVIQDSSKVKLSYAGWKNETLSPFSRKRTIVLNAKPFGEN